MMLKYVWDLTNLRYTIDETAIVISPMHQGRVMKYLISPSWFTVLPAFWAVMRK